MIENMLQINHTLQIPEEDLSESFIRSPGPGGQHVNKTATAVQLRFDTSQVNYLSERVKTRLKILAGRRMSAEGIVVIEAKRYRSQERNREDARSRLAVLLRRALEKPSTRLPTQPSAGAARRRVEAKKKRAAIKQLRKKPADQE